MLFPEDHQTLSTTLILSKPSEIATQIHRKIYAFVSHYPAVMIGIFGRLERKKRSKPASQTFVQRASTCERQGHGGAPKLPPRTQLPGIQLYHWPSVPPRTCFQTTSTGFAIQVALIGPGAKRSGRFSLRKTATAPNRQPCGKGSLQRKQASTWMRNDNFYGLPFCVPSSCFAFAKRS